MDKNENGHLRGLHIVVINTIYGTVETCQVFDTYKTSNNFDEFIMKDIPENYIIVAACSDECISNLSQKGKQWFSNLGSKQIWHLKYRCGFSFIGLSKRMKAFETRALSS